jgi:hypothetical protein
LFFADFPQVDAMIRSHFTVLATNPMYRAALKHVVFEANMSHIVASQGYYIAREIMGASNVIAESKDPDNLNRVGVWTGEFEKEAYALALRKHIMNLNFRVSKHLFGRKAEADVAKLTKQLYNFRLDRTEPKDLVNGKYKYSFTGKTPGGDQDDEALVAMMNVYWAEKRREVQEFREQCATRGVRI